MQMKVRGEVKGITAAILLITACGADRFREVHGGVIDRTTTEEVSVEGEKPYWRVYRERAAGDRGCYLLPRPEAQREEMIGCNEAVSLANMLNKGLHFRARLIEAVPSFEHAAVAPYPYEDDILKCCPPSSPSLRSLCDYTVGRSKMKERPMIERLMSLEEANALAACLNERYRVK